MSKEIRNSVSEEDIIRDFDNGLEVRDLRHSGGMYHLTHGVVFSGTRHLQDDVRRLRRRLHPDSCAQRRQVETASSEEAEADR